MTHGYFKPLRRKIGTFTLLMTCVLMGAWLRSVAVEDVLKIPSAEGIRFFYTLEEGRISWGEMAGPESEMSAKRVTQWKWLSGRIDPSWTTNTSDRKFEHYEHDWKWDFCGFYFAEGHGRLTGPCPSTRLWLYVIPFWSVVTPLTLLCAWLLLSKSPAKAELSTPATGENP